MIYIVSSYQEVVMFLYGIIVGIVIFPMIIAASRSK